MIRLAARRYNEGAHDAAFEYLSFHYHAPFVFGIQATFDALPSDEHHGCVAIQRSVLMRSYFVSLSRRYCHVVNIDSIIDLSQQSL